MRSFQVDNHQVITTTTTTTNNKMSKRKLPRRELPWISTLLDKLPYSRLPTNGIVLRRLMFEVEHAPSGASLSSAVRDELVKVWEYAGYRDILKQPCYIVKQITSLHDTYKKMNKTPLSKREADFFKSKEADFLKSLDLLLNITVESLRTSSLITEDDRDFLLNNWDKTISSIQDKKTKLLVEKNIARKDRYQRFSSTQCSPKTPTLQPEEQSDSSLNLSLDTEEEYIPKRICTPSSAGTTVTIDKDILKKIGPAADRLNLSNNVVTTVVAAITNHGGGNIDDLALSKSSARRHRGAARAKQTAEIKKNFTCSTSSQINFDGKLLPNLEGFNSVNRLAVVLVQKDDNKILCIARTDDSTGKMEAETVKKALDDWDLSSYIIASSYCTLLQQLLDRQLLWLACTLLQQLLDRRLLWLACTLLQQLLDRQLLWLACRHHILELVIGAAFRSIFGDTKSPEVTLFKTLKTSWNSLDLDSFVLPEIPSSYQKEKDKLLSFINSLLSPEEVKKLPRCDYK